MKKVLLATAVVLAMGSTTAMATEGGRINFEGLVSTETCTKTIHSVVGDSDTDGTITLGTAHISEIAAEVNTAAAGAKPEDFSIIINCSQANPAKTTVDLSLSSSFSNSKGTLNNNVALSRNGEAAAQGVDIAVHSVGAANAVSLVKINDPSNKLSQTFNAGVATFDFKASYVKADSTTAVTSGPVSTNAIYTLVYQ